nr:hypothetical protein BDOA9_0138330 [Bradyrhizobium sp. DOA9]
MVFSWSVACDPPERAARSRRPRHEARAGCVRRADRDGLICTNVQIIRSRQQNNGVPAAKAPDRSHSGRPQSKACSDGKGFLKDHLAPKDPEIAVFSRRFQP